MLVPLKFRASVPPETLCRGREDKLQGVWGPTSDGGCLEQVKNRKRDRNKPLQRGNGTKLQTSPGGRTADEPEKGAHFTSTQDAPPAAQAEPEALADLRASRLGAARPTPSAVGRKLAGRLRGGSPCVSLTHSTEQPLHPRSTPRPSHRSEVKAERIRKHGYASRSAASHCGMTAATRTHPRGKEGRRPAPRPPAMARRPPGRPPLHWRRARTHGGAVRRGVGCAEDPAP